MDVRSTLRNLPRLLFGRVEWTAPPWVGRSVQATHGAMARARRNPRGSLAGVLAAAVLVGGGYAAWRWYEARPRPELVEVTVGAPARTCYECEPPGNPQPLTLAFGASTAPLDAAGKPLDAAKLGLRLSPAQAGSWAWTDDRNLVFTPRADWPVGEDFTIDLPRSGLVAPQLRLAEYRLRFTSPAFGARMVSNDFYQDPVQAGDKKVVTTLEFTHPVDAASLEQRVSLAVTERVTDTQERKLDPPAFTITYDKLRLHAYVHSAQLPVPAKGGKVSVAIARGLRAARGGNATPEPLTADTPVPGRDSLALLRTQLQIVRDERNEPSQALLLQTSHSVTESQMTGKVTAWLLPVKHPDAKLQAEWERVRGNRERPYGFSGVAQVTPAVLAAAQRLALAYVPNERDHVELHSFRFEADPGRALYVQVDAGLTSFGGYRMPERSDALLPVPAYPQELQIAQAGSLLALSGKRKLTVFSRDVAAVRVQVSRLLPNQLQHFVSQSYGSLSGPEFSSGLGANELTETFTSILNLPSLRPGEPHYEALDIGDYLRRPGASRLGVFLLKLQAWDPKAGSPAVDRGGCDDCGYEARRDDTRLVLVTDLGLLVKRAQDGTQDVFVQSIHSGEPVPGVSLEVIGRNGEPVLREVTDATGHARFRDLGGFRNEKRPVLYLARLGEDLSFLPIDDRARPLDLSRFDVGGVSNVPGPDSLSAYLFSDRGIYRPGDEIRAAAIVKSQNWKRLPAGLPLQLTVTDPRGSVVRRETLKLSDAGFEEIRHRTRDTSPAGSYTLALAVIRENGANEDIGTLDVTVREFLPDRLRMTTHFSTEAREGWVSPDQLGANVTLENLFGTPATKRRITAQLRLSPAFPQFPRWKDYQFRDPQAAKEGFTENLAPVTTDDQGRATLALDLGRFTRATYRAVLAVQGFEADGGRGVTGEAAQLVSSLPWLVGWKVDGDLAYVARGSERRARVIAVDPRLQGIAASGLLLDRIEQRYVSMLMQQDSGTYRYESRLKETVLSSAPFALPAGGAELPLDTGTPGRFSYVVRDAQGQVFARIDYAVAGAANLSRSLDRNAELQITLAKADYAPGDEIEMQIQAPYTGTSLITIERERVYAWRWFRSTTTSSIQKIRVPAEALEGNAYVQVTFVRDPSSEEIYMSPLSYGIQPFSIALDARRNPVTLETAELVKPGEPLTIRYSSARRSRIAVFAVDEGILQVAAYKTPDPLGHFFQKRAHTVQTRQILDLILPEFRESMLSAPGGDEGGALGRHLNPFKRKTDPPVAWWSGIVEADSRTRELRYDVPESFNGRLRVMAVAVGPDAIGTAERATTVRGDFVLSPNAPLTVTPGDEFDVSVGVANNVAGSGAGARVDVALAVGAGLQVVGSATQTLPVAELRESSARFRVKVLDAPGGSFLTFTSSLAASRGRATATLSIRPATAYATLLHTGSFRGSLDVPLTRTLYPAFRTQRATASPVPLVLAHGLASYLARYPYSCTEQIVSQALPALVLANRPEFARLATGDAMAGLVDELRLRQTPEGAYRYWAGGVLVVEDASVWAQALLLEARESGKAVPQDLLDSGNRYLRTLARRDGDTLEEERSSAWAIYLLARQGVVVSNEVAAQQARLARSHAPRWTTDITAGYVAAAYELMKQRELADRTLAPLLKGVRSGDDRWHRGVVADAELLYLVSRHFADRLPRLPANLLPELARRVGGGELHSLSAASTILALDAYAKASAPRIAGALTLTSLQAQGRTEALKLPEGLFPRVDYPAASTALRLRNDGELAAFYSVEESGFDRLPPATGETKGLEILREYLDAAGKPVTSAKVGEELTVRVRFRSVGRPSVDDLVVVDLLPGGFDLVMPPAATGGSELLAATPTASADEEPEPDVDAEEGAEGDGDEGFAGNGDCNCGFLWNRPSGFPDYADLREDRVVLYGNAAEGLQEYTYRIKATNAGTFTTPPAQAESMYDGTIRARSIAGRLVVSAP